LPLAAYAQQPVKSVVGFVSGRGADDSTQVVAAFRQGLAETGFVDGTNVAIDFRWAQGDYSKLPALAADLVRQQPAVLVAVGGDVSALVASKATTTIPVVFGMGGDPVKAGVVANFNRPGGNITGFTLWTNEMESKRLGLLRELVPGASEIGILVNPDFPPTVWELEHLQIAGKSVGQAFFVGPPRRRPAKALGLTVPSSLLPRRRGDRMMPPCLKRACGIYLRLTETQSSAVPMSAASD
jgi:putative tryptophan/tyrosine transport system substrate-binding protein